MNIDFYEWGIGLGFLSMAVFHLNLRLRYIQQGKLREMAAFDRGLAAGRQATLREYGLIKTEPEAL